MVDSARHGAGAGAGPAVERWPQRCRFALCAWVSAVLLLVAWERGVRPRIPVDDHMADPPRRHGPPSCPSQGFGRVPRQVFMTSNSSSPFFKTVLEDRNAGWKVRVFNDETMAAYVGEHCPWVLGSFLCLVPKAYQADVFRACALYTEGGVYLDDDILPFHPLTDYFNECDNVTLVNGHRDYTPWTGSTVVRARRIELNFAVAKPGHPMFECVMATINQRVRDHDYGVSTTDITGPIVAHRCYSAHTESTNVAMAFGDAGRFYWAGQTGAPPIAFQRTGDHKSATHYSILYDRRQVFSC